MFDIETWRAKVNEILPTAVQWLQHQAQDVPLLVYSTVVGLTLWPLVSAATQEEGLWSVMDSLYEVVSGPGRKDIARQIEQWRKEDRVDEAMVIQWVREETAVNPHLLESFHTILEQFNAFHLAQQHLSEPQRYWFHTTLQAELTQLGSWLRSATRLPHVGAIKQGNITVHERGGNMQQSVVYGNVITGNVYHGPPISDPVEALTIYRHVLVRSHKHLPLQGLDVDASDPTKGQRPLGLAHVYVALDTTTQIRSEVKQDQRLEEIGESQPLTALAAVVQQRQLVLLGDAGSGKSTFVNHLAHCLAAHALWPEGNWLAQLPYWPSDEEPLLPFPIILRDLAQTLPTPLPKEATAKYLWLFIERCLQDVNLGFAAEALSHALETGRVLLLLDGLDEITSPAKRLFVGQVVEAFVLHRYPHNRTVITCRVLSYQPPADKEMPDLRLPVRDFPAFELAPFNETKIDQFIEAWYKELVRQGHIGAQDGTRLALRLKTAVRQSDLWRLAGNPLLLTVMALVHTHEGHLPDARALLYEKTIEMLLWRWEAGKADSPALRQLLLAADRSEMDLKRLLWRLAYEAHSQMNTNTSQEALADIEELHLRRALLILYPDHWDWSFRVAESPSC